ncbi:MULTISPECIES: VOC family protein [unclassified Candidatus Frackibacter]|uniref:VOC family protein n=1 Tax=unclassified Candidatus Frackibacter TaxID=2648818 RepID=UPI00079A2D31|nr:MULTISPECIES: VOC family protein [unclassified Candidatus Frackibacter]KXS42548.1 MAG: glyoxylase I family protein [Candidatus Frackibacter sp. T328-2]SDC69202.1 glyoxylase I family protein [Candidatus Frackibacter sp. WG11]SEM82518.1 glyoxylase I family protein [Candidatus Frackibacter sp. WG12]SFL92796.1 glyoxylase I family protein [Candidatus Frackibacter sp. WG13]
MFKRIDHVEIIPSDIEVSITFYTEILGFKIKQREEVDAPSIKEVVFLELNDSMLELLSMKEPQPINKQDRQVGYRMLALEVEDMDEVITYLEDKGVEVSWGPVDLGPSKRAEIRDPDGLPIELRQW